MSNVQVSVIMPSYNQGIFLNEAIQSVIDSTLDNWECIIINDGSSDNTSEIAQEWMKIDERISLIEQNNQGVSEARNNGIAKAKGKYILPLDADDRISSEYMELALDAFLKDPKLTLVYCEANKFGLVNNYWKLEEFSLKKLSRFNMIFNSAIYKKEDGLRCGGYDVNMDTGIEDWEFWINLLKDGGKVLRLNHLGFYYRIREKSRTERLDNSALENLYQYMCKKHIDFFFIHYGSFISVEREMKNAFVERKEILKSKKYAIDLLLKNLTGTTLFHSKLLR